MDKRTRAKIICAHFFVMHSDIITFTRSLPSLVSIFIIAGCLHPHGKMKWVNALQGLCPHILSKVYYHCKLLL